VKRAVQHAQQALRAWKAVHTFEISKEGRAVVQRKNRQQGIVKLGQKKNDGDAWDVETRPKVRKTAQELNQSQLFLAVFPQQCMGQLASFGPTNLTPFSPKTAPGKIPWCFQKNRPCGCFRGSASLQVLSAMHLAVGETCTGLTQIARLGLLV
jgi:hypothetical protein